MVPNNDYERDGVAACRIAMWSGPRNISTAMLRSWGNRPDCTVVDEPLYGPFLHATGLEHPMRQEVLDAQGTDWRSILNELTGPVPGGHHILYQKHMAHHLLPEMDMDWLRGMRVAFLIRDPQEMLTSLMKIIPEPRVEDTGLPQQKRLMDWLESETDQPLRVFDSRDVLEQPHAMLEVMCASLDVPFDESMLSWPAGKRDTDGVWAPYWYGTVEQSTGFATYRPKNETVPENLQPVLDACLSYYNEMATRKMTVPS